MKNELTLGETSKRCNIIGFDERERGPTAKKGGWSPDASKGKDGYSQEPPERNRLADILILAHRDPMSDF